MRGFSSVGRASDMLSEGDWFESFNLHIFNLKYFC